MNFANPARSTPVPGKAEQLLLCFSHLRWDFVFQRPQHLMLRFAAAYNVVVWEEPWVYGTASARVELREGGNGIRVATPHLPEGLSDGEASAALKRLLDGFLANEPQLAVRWYYTPMMFGFSRHLPAACTVYDCMDELSAFRFAPPELLTLEGELMGAADLVFTGGYSLYEAKRERHPDVRPFPSSVDVAHFARARDVEPGQGETARFGFYGVIDERIDLQLIADLADARPGWSVEMVGPIAKIDEADLPQRANLIYSGQRGYDELPGAVAGWDVALMPFAINQATRFISPTKTPEYLAAGRPVVSTPIIDVARHYGELDAVKIAARGARFLQACEEALALARGEDRGWRDQADTVLAAMSWDATAVEMLAAIGEVIAGKARITTTGGGEQPHYDYLIVGAGFAGSVMAERLAADGGYKVLVIDRRPHVAGNAYDVKNDAGILFHQYGPHIFHTNSDEVFGYLSRFTAWRQYEHRVLAEVGGKQVPIPINRTTLNALYDAGLETEADAAAFLAARAEPVDEIKTSEDVVVSAVGQELYQAFFRGYTRKQWGLDPSQLDRSVTARVPTRTSTDDRYFGDKHQAMPAAGFTAMFTAMLDHPNITVLLDTDFADVAETVSFDRLIYTGPIDEYFGHRYGKLPYRSLRFEHSTLPVEQHQAVAVVNYPDEAVPYTRITEYKHLTGQTAPHTSLTVEYPAAEGDPYYPIPRPENQALFKRYEALALAEPDVLFVGRLATYRYYNMDQVVGQALATYRRLKAQTVEVVSATSAAV